MRIELSENIFNFQSKNKILRQPGVEPGSAAWKATMITATPLTLSYFTFKLTRLK
jgi:hypothetical protein